MPDLLVNLLNIPSPESLPDPRVNIRRAQPFELTPVHRFIEEHFALSWADEVTIGFVNKPISVYIATVDQQLIGFAAYECTRRAFFGPTGVRESARGKGIGKQLLLHSLVALRDLGYVYGIIGGVGPVAFYEKAVGAIVIPGSDPGIYTDRLKPGNEC